MYQAIVARKEQLFFYTCIFLIGIALVLSSWWVLHGNIDFHTDIARDFLLFEDIYFNKNITLLGPRSGGISGVFHGPLWLYLNIPAYAAGNGNPVAVGWFWVLLYIITIGIVYYVGKKVFDSRAAIVGACLFSISTAHTIPFLFNPFGAVMLAPLFFYGTWVYLEKQKLWSLILAILTLGFSIQFQMAFALPMLVAVTPLYIYLIIKYKNYFHLFTFLLLCIPLSTFILFDLRHDFLQTRSVLSYLSGGANATKIEVPLHLFFWKRIIAMSYEAIGLMTGYTTFVTFSLIGLFFYFYSSTKKYKSICKLFVYLYLSFWIITLPYKGTIWGYYYWPFISIISVLVGGMIVSFPKWVLIGVFGLVYISNVVYSYKIIVKPFAADDTSLWQFYKIAAEKVYNDTPNEFGFFIYTTDQYGYSTRYGMNYVQRAMKEDRGIPFEKKALTYLLIDDPGDHAYTNHIGWRTYDVAIKKKPVKKIQLSKNYWIEKYVLTKEEISVSANPNLIQNLMFR